MPQSIDALLARGGVRRRFASLWSIAWLLLVCAWTPLAHAHAALMASDPADGALLSALPAHATLNFDEPVSPLVFKLLAPDGATRALHHVAAGDGELRIELPSQTMHGTYALSWRVVSADGHPVGGSILFSVGKTSAVQVVPGHAARLRDPAIWLARWALYVSLFFGVGGAVFRAFMGGADGVASVWPRRAIGLGLVAVPVGWALQGLDALDAPWRGVFDANIWVAAFNTSYAATLMLDASALAIAFATLAAVRAQRIRLGAIASVLLLGAALAASGHASVAPPQWLNRSAVLLHGIAIAAWLGALLPLLALAREDGNAIAQALRIFSRRIGWVVLVLIASGIVLALLQIDRLDALWLTAYGKVLLAKLSLVAVLFALAAWNRYRLSSRVLEGDEHARRALARIIVVEIVVALCVLATVALWRFTPPPRRASALAAPAGVSADFRDSNAEAKLVFTPARQTRPGSLRLLLTDAHAAPLLPKAVIVSFSDVAQGLEAVQREAVQVRPGLWEISPLNLPAQARWDVRVDILMTDFDRIRLRGELEMRPAMHAH